MLNIPVKVNERVSNGMKKFQQILISAKSRDVGESDTVIIITDILAEVLGYDKYSEITSELAIKGTYCDLAIKLGGRVQLIIEVKAIGLELKDQYVRQAIDYGAHNSTDWVLLTNGIQWKVFRVLFGKPVDQELIYEFDFTNLNPKSSEHIELLYHLSKEGWLKSSLVDFETQRQTLSKYFIANLLIAPVIIDTLRKELKKIAPDVRIQPDDIKNVIQNEVLKREVTEGEKAEEASKKLNKVYQKIQRQKQKVITKPTNSVADTESSLTQEESE